jgi:hypothetical protein
VGERLKPPVLKTGVAQATASSNLAPSAKFTRENRLSAVLIGVSFFAGRCPVHNYNTSPKRFRDIAFLQMSMNLMHLNRSAARGEHGGFNRNDLARPGRLGSVARIVNLKSLTFARLQAWLGLSSPCCP